MELLYFVKLNLSLTSKKMYPEKRSYISGNEAF